MDFAAATIAGLIVMLAASSARAWPPRQPPLAPPLAHELLRPERWPVEPQSPAPIDPERFRAALATVCRRAPERVPADEIVAAAAAAGVDPFVLAALMVERSRCQPRYTGRDGHGALAIHARLYFRRGAPRPPVAVSEFAWRAVFDPARNLAAGARLLRMWQDRHESLDARFSGVGHRSGVAHFFWGDSVRSSGGEDLVFTTRRRLLAHYAPAIEVPRPSVFGIDVVSPLEGTPRVASSGPGEDRDGGARRHRGVDIAASVGEPVRAIADAVVVFAGVSFAGSIRSAPIRPERLARYRRLALGPGGIYVCLGHGDADRDSASGAVSGARSIVSCYMHLERYLVALGERVTAGQTIGFVGRTGVKSAPAHLHLEIRIDGRAQNPLRCLGDLVIPPRATKTYRWVAAARRARQQRAAVLSSGGGLPATAGP